VSVGKMTFIYCDGLPDCNWRGNCYGEADCSTSNAKQQRSRYVADGWIYKGGKDYCPDCTKALFKIKEQA